jgi:hypothetical protein
MSALGRKRTLALRILPERRAEAANATESEITAISAGNSLSALGLRLHCSCLGGRCAHSFGTDPRKALNPKV